MCSEPIAGKGSPHTDHFDGLFPGKPGLCGCLGFWVFIHSYSVHPNIVSQMSL